MSLFAIIVIGFNIGMVCGFFLTIFMALVHEYLDYNNLPDLKENELVNYGD